MRTRRVGMGAKIAGKGPIAWRLRQEQPMRRGPGGTGPSIATIMDLLMNPLEGRVPPRPMHMTRSRSARSLVPVRI